MFTPPLEQIVTPNRLKEAAWAVTSKAAGPDGRTIDAYRDEEALRRLHEEIVNGRYAPLPLERIELTKEDGTARPLGISAPRDKIVQKCLAEALTPHFDRTFSNKSYGYRPGRGVLRAVNRTRDFLAKNHRFVFKTDIDNFFETIPHDKLLQLLRETIADGRIVDLIAMFLKNGAFKGFDYLDHTGGVHQGDPLSPLPRTHLKNPHGR